MSKFEGQPRIARFDLHMHTDLSDGLHSIDEMTNTAKARGLDYHAISDHNVIAETENAEYIRAVELSGLWAHFLLVNLIEPEQINKLFKKNNVPERSSAARISRKAQYEFFSTTHEMGGLVIAAHPGYRIMSEMPTPIIRAFDEGLIDGAEIHNHDVFRALDKNFGCLGRGIYKLWHRYTKSVFENYMPTYAFSDAHHMDRIGLAYSQVELPTEYSLNEQALIAYLKSSNPIIRHVFNENYEPHPHSL